MPLVTKLLAELSSLKRPLFTFEQAALQLQSESSLHCSLSEYIGS